MQLAEARHVVWQAFRQGRRAGKHAHAALHTLAIGAQFDTHLVQAGQHLARAHQQGLAGGRWLDTAPAARQQRHTHFRLQCRHTLAQRRGDERLAGGRARDVALFADRDEMLQGHGVEGSGHDVTRLDVTRVDVTDWNADLDN
jgi:hypothetical protein